MLAPLGDHYDDGFGAMGLSFSLAARTLIEARKDNRNIFLEHLPSNFLLRHAIELYLKSGIIILHRRLNIPFGDQPHTAQPAVRVGGAWKAIQKVHSVGDLYAHWKDLIQTNRKLLESICKFESAKWDVPRELDEAIAIIDETDSRSTYYRYPDLRDEKADLEKSNFKEVPVSELFSSGQGQQQPAVLFAIKNDEGDFTRAFALDDNTEQRATSALLAADKEMDEFHAMMRLELTDTW